MTPQFALHALSFAAGFWWMCHRKDIDFMTILTSLLGGFALGAGVMVGIKLAVGTSLVSQLPLLPFYSLLGATCFAWVQAREALALQACRQDVYALTLSFFYFLTPWKGAYVIMGLVGALPAAIVVLICWRRDMLSEGARTFLMFWSLVASLAIGIQGILVSPESIRPAMDFAMGPSMITTFMFKALQASGFVVLALNVFPLLTWLQTRGDRVERTTEENAPVKAVGVFTVMLGLPLLMNWKFGFAGYSAMLDYSLSWGPILAAAFAKSYGESAHDTGLYLTPQSNGDIHEAS